MDETDLIYFTTKKYIFTKYVYTFTISVFYFRRKNYLIHFCSSIDEIHYFTCTSINRLIQSFFQQSIKYFSQKKPSKTIYIKNTFRCVYISRFCIQFFNQRTSFFTTLIKTTISFRFQFLFKFDFISVIHSL